MIGYILTTAALTAAQPAGVQMRDYGTTGGGERVAEYTLRNAHGMTVRVITLGAIVTAIEVPDREGHVDNVVLGLPDLAAYEAHNASYRFGAIMGRYAGRIANARFTLDGREIRLTANDGPNALHGGAGIGFDARVWRAEPRGDAAIRLIHSSPDGEQGFPGRFDVAVTYTLSDNNALQIDFEAQSDAPTVHNLTNHSYFNLAGAGAGPVSDHRLLIFAHEMVEASDAGIPTGRFVPIAGTPFDFRTSHALGDCIDDAMPRISGFCGYNHSYLVERPQPGMLSLAAHVDEPVSGRTLDVLTTEPTVHIYTANHFSGNDLGNAGVPLRPLTGLALETQHLPDSPNQPGFPTTVLRPGETFRSTTVFRFGTDR
jgi:aldose 1-epimerase